MAAFLALGRVLVDSVIGNIFSYVEDSSAVVNCGTDATDIANLDDINYLTVLPHSPQVRFNRGLSSTRYLYKGSLEFADGN